MRETTGTLIGAAGQVNQRLAGDGAADLPTTLILNDSDDSELCNGVFMLIADRHGNKLDVAKMNEPERVVTLVWHSFGIIGNGGFQYLFEGTFKGDPGFVLTAAAFRRIRCAEAAEAFEEALALFPGNRPPSNIEARLEIYQSVPELERRRIDTKFCDSAGDLRAKLAAFIRANARDLEHPADHAR